MKSILKKQGNKLLRESHGELLCIEPWGTDSLRVRCIMGSNFIDENWALDTEPADIGASIIDIQENEAIIQNGRIIANLRSDGLITYYNKEKMILQEYIRNRNDLTRYISTIRLAAREWKPRMGDDYSLTVRFESDPNERLFGMGQYQHGYLNQKDCRLLLEQRNSQASIPFVLSDKGYGLFWNNPATGWTSFSKNLTEWHADSTKQMDYWITAGDTPSDIVEQFTEVTGKPPMMPEYGMGFWQSKLRYQTQQELLEVAREYKRRGLPLSVIVIDFFHWTNHGDWKFDKDYWPDPEAMTKELKDMGIETMVSIWPTVAKSSENYDEMARKNYLVKNDIGITTHMEFLGNTVFFDATNPGAREFIWEKAKQNYYDKGVKLFWLDEAEPEYSSYDFSLYRYHIGPALQNSNIFPRMFAKAFYDGRKAEGEEDIINLVRCAWAGSQKYGALVWSGDVDSSFRGLREQVVAGLNTGLAGIPWWTSDIGGFLRGQIHDPDYRECLIRWFQFGTFCPVMRLHGERMPYKEPLGTSGGGQFFSGAENEVWSYGEEAYEIMKKYILLREEIKPYITKLMSEANKKGTPVIRPIFYDYPDDVSSWDIDDQYMFGPDVLVAPILYDKMRNRKIYLPKGDKWRNAHTGEVLSGGTQIDCDAPIEVIPIFLREGGQIDFSI